MRAIIHIVRVRCELITKMRVWVILIFFDLVKAEERPWWWPRSICPLGTKFHPDSNGAIEYLKSWITRHQREGNFGVNNCQNLQHEQTSTEPLLKVVKCDEDGAIWNYRFLVKERSKISKKKPFGSNPRGKISFYGSQGYDHGMKSGKCIKLGDKEIKDVDGVSFDPETMTFVNSELTFVTITFNNGTRIKVSDFTVGYINGIVAKFATVIDQETNSLTPDKKLKELSLYINGKEKASWIILDSGDLLLRMSSGDILVLHETNDVLSGNLDPEGQLLHDANHVNFFSLKFDDLNACFPTLLKANESVQGRIRKSLDLKSGEWTDKVTSKLRRFLNLAADTNVKLHQIFDPGRFNEGTKNDVEEIFRVISVEKSGSGTHSLVSTPYNWDGRAKAKVVGKFSGKSLTILFLSDWKRQDVPSNSSEIAKELKGWMEEYLTYDEVPVLIQSPDLIKKMTGDFENGKFVDGSVAIIHFCDGSYIEGFVKDNAFQGLVRRVGPELMAGDLPKRFRSLEKNVRPTTRTRFGFSKGEIHREVEEVGIFLEGRSVGPKWIFLVGGSVVCLQKPLGDGKGVFLYKDNLRKGFKGRFDLKNLTLVEGGPAEVVDSETVNLIEVPKAKNIVFNPEVDEVEEEWIFRNSSGVFVKKDIPTGTGTFVSFFAGNIHDAEDYKPKSSEHWRPIYDRVKIYPYLFNTWLSDAKVRKYSKIVHVPNTGQCRTLGHLIRHSFWHWNCAFVTTHHPRYGIIPAVVTTGPIAKGQELMCHHNLPFHVAGARYQERWREEVDEDWPGGPFGNRGGRREKGLEIPPMLDDDGLYDKFSEFATTTLRLSRFS